MPICTAVHNTDSIRRKNVVQPKKIKMIGTRKAFAIFIIWCLVEISGSASQRISAKKCAEYKNLYREESEDQIFGDKMYSDLKCPEFESGGTIVGGNKSHPNEYPAMASLLYRNGNKLLTECGGTLISNEFVLTAAHCFNKNKRPVKIALGEANLAPGAYRIRRRDMEIAEIIIHPEYKPPASYNDIALIRLKRKLNLAYEYRPAIRPACLAQTEVPTSETVIATGWGLLMALGDTSYDLQAVGLKVSSREECSDFYRDSSDFATKFPGVSDSDKKNWLIPETNLCAWDEGKDTCNGDSGGPLFYSMDKNFPCLRHIVGVTSFGPRLCGLTETPGVFTKVLKYLDWIEGIVWPGM